MNTVEKHIFLSQYTVKQRQILKDQGWGVPEDMLSEEWTLPRYGESCPNCKGWIPYGTAHLESVCIQTLVEQVTALRARFN